MKSSLWNESKAEITDVNPWCHPDVGCCCNETGFMDPVNAFFRVISKVSLKPGIVNLCLMLPVFLYTLSRYSFLNNEQLPDNMCKYLQKYICKFTKSYNFMIIRLWGNLNNVWALLSANWKPVSSCASGLLLPYNLYSLIVAIFIRHLHGEKI